MAITANSYDALFSEYRSKYVKGQQTFQIALYGTWVEFSKCSNFFENGLKLFSLVLYTSFFLAVITDMERADIYILFDTK